MMKIPPPPSSQQNGIVPFILSLCYDERGGAVLSNGKLLLLVKNWLEPVESKNPTMHTGIEVQEMPCLIYNGCTKQ